MLLSKSSEYGIRASLYLAARDAEKYTSVRQIGEDLDISPTFLTKVFQELNEAGLVVSRRGAHGGVSLEREPKTITLYDIVVAIDGEAIFRDCVLGLPGCGEERPCPLHDTWVRQRDQIELSFRRANLADVAEKTRASDFRLAAAT